MFDWSALLRERSDSGKQANGGRVTSFENHGLPPARKPVARSAAALRGGQATISSVVFRRVLGDYLASKSCEWESLLSAARFSVPELADVDTRFSVDDERKLWRAAERLTGDPEIGLHCGAYVRLSALDAFGYLMKSSATLRDALTQAARHQRFIVSGTLVQFECSESEGRFSIELAPGLVGESRHPIECAFAALVRVGREVTRSSWSPRAVVFQHRRPRAAGNAADFFKAKVEYSGQRSVFYVRSADLELPIDTHDPDLLRILERHVTDVTGRLSEETALSASVRRDLLNALGRRSVSVAASARRLGVGPRTLQRRLRAQGTSFSDLLESLRRELALAYVQQGKLDAAEVGFNLGFARPSAFYRAFRRWTGGTPGEYRAAHCRDG